MEEIIIKENENYSLTAATNNKLVLLEKQIKALTEQKNKIRDLIQKEMEEKGFYKIENDELSITYIAATTRESFDSKTFKEEHRDIYNLYTKQSEVAPSVRIKMKG